MTIKNLRTTRWLLLAAAAAVLAGCATTGNGPSGAATKDADDDEVAVSAIRLIVYREAGEGANATRPLNVFIDDRYQATLIGNAYAEHVLCPGERKFAVAFEDPQNAYAVPEKGEKLKLDRAPVQYLRVAEEGDAPGFRLVDAEAAGPALEKLEFDPAAAAEAAPPDVNCAVP